MSTLMFLTEVHRLRTLVEQTSNQLAHAPETPEPLRRQLFQIRDSFVGLEARAASLESEVGAEASESLKHAALNVARVNQELAATHFALEPDRFFRRCTETISALDRFASLLPGDPTTPPPDF